METLGGFWDIFSEFGRFLLGDLFFFGAILDGFRRVWMFSEDFGWFFGDFGWFWGDFGPFLAVLWRFWRVLGSLWKTLDGLCVVFGKGEFVFFSFLPL